MTFEQIVKQLKTGKIVKEAKLKITIPEGKQLTQIATIMSQRRAILQKTLWRN